ncbi:MAG: hypothetical protein JW768_06475 [Chitinispirillaceae bacterium]|nr:hypothetical protein [Chitinispirillaceae bacterium]
MRAVCFFLIIIASAGHAFEVNKTISAGPAIGVGEKSDETNIGPGGSIDINAKVHKYAGLGFHADYVWFTAKNNDNFDFYRVGAHFLDLALVPRLYIPIDVNTELFLEVDPGVASTYAYLDITYPNGRSISEGDFFVDMLMSYGMGVMLRHLVITFKMKTLFFHNHAPDIDIRDYQAIQWILLTIGLPLAG